MTGLPPKTNVTRALLGSVLLLVSPVHPALADGKRPTPILEVDLRTGTKRSFDHGKPKTQADKELDALLDATTGESFSSKELNKISGALRRFLRSSRPRAQPSLILFLYPGRISKTELRELREVKVDVELQVDPCHRTVCRDAVGQHLELLGKSLRQAVLRTSHYVINFSHVTVRARLDASGASSYETYRFSAAEVVQAGKRKGAGALLVKRSTAQRAGYEKNMVKLIVRRLRARRVRLKGAVRVDRVGRALSVALTVRSDRVRVKAHVLGAFIGAAEALARSSITPAEVELTVTALVPMRGIKKRIFRCGIHPLKLHLRGRLQQTELWSTYVVEQKKKGRHLSFDDSDARGAPRARQSPPQRVNELLAAHIGTFAPCLQAEARKRRAFRGVTLEFAISQQGSPQKLKVTPPGTSASTRLCLRRALSKIRFSRHAGPPRRVKYPINIRR